jgi:hypothetical protein
MSTTTEVSNSQDVIDSRDVIARIEELEGIDGIEDNIANLIESDEATELVALRDLQDQAEGYCADWTYGATLIRDSYFESYAMELADDLGAIDRGAKWPQTCIDWKRAAEELQQDYTSVDFDGVTYWIR